MMCTLILGISCAESDVSGFYQKGNFPLIKKAINFTEGLAYMEYDDGYGTKVASVVDEEGNIRFTMDGPPSYFSGYHGGSAFYTEPVEPWESRDNITDTLVDGWGNIIYQTSGDENSTIKWERICGYANGYYILTRRRSGMTSSMVEIAFMNPDGTFARDYYNDFTRMIVTPFDDPEDPLDGIYCNNDVGYAGKGWYWIGRTFLNVDRGLVWEGTGDVNSDFDHAGMLILSSGWTYDENMNELRLVGFKYIFPGRRAYMLDNMYFSDDDCFCDALGNVILSLDDHYPENNIQCSPFYGGEYAIMEIYGKDGHSYVTMIDRNGNEQFEPIMIKNYFREVFDGYAVIAPILPGQDGADEYVIINSKGEICHSISKDFGMREIANDYDYTSPTKSSFSYSEGWLLINYRDKHTGYYRFYPLKYAAELGDERYDVGLPDPD